MTFGTLAGLPSCNLAAASTNTKREACIITVRVKHALSLFEIMMQLKVVHWFGLFLKNLLKFFNVNFNRTSLTTLDKQQQRGYRPRR